MSYDRLVSVIVFDEQCSKYENHSIYKSQFFKKNTCEYDNESDTVRRTFSGLSFDILVIKIGELGKI